MVYLIPYFKLNMAISKHTPLEILTILAKDANYSVRVGAAGNPNTPEHILIELADDKDTYVRRGVGSNPKISENILTKLANDDHYSVVYQVAGNLSAPPELLDEIFENNEVIPKHLCNLDFHKELSKIIINNPNILSKTLAKILARYGNPRGREKAAGNLSAPPETLAAIFVSVSPAVFTLEIRSPDILSGKTYTTFSGYREEEITGQIKNL